MDVVRVGCGVPVIAATFRFLGVNVQRKALVVCRSLMDHGRFKRVPAADALPQGCSRSFDRSVVRDDIDDAAYRAAIEGGSAAGKLDLFDPRDRQRVPFQRPTAHADLADILHYIAVDGDDRPLVVKPSQSYLNAGVLPLCHHNAGHVEENIRRRFYLPYYC